MIFEAFLNLDNTIDNNNDNVQKAEKDKLDSIIEILQGFGHASVNFFYHAKCQL